MFGARSPPLPGRRIVATGMPARGLFETPSAELVAQTRILPQDTDVTLKLHYIFRQFLTHEVHDAGWVCMLTRGADSSRRNSTYCDPLSRCHTSHYAIVQLCDHLDLSSQKCYHARGIRELPCDRMMRCAARCFV